jgi:hypothetical protein
VEHAVETNTSALPFPSPGTTCGSALENATYRPPSEIEPIEPPSASSMPFASTLTRSVAP